MRLLIDECVDERLRLLFSGHDCQTARFAKLAGLKNGVSSMLPKPLASMSSLPSTRICPTNRI